MTIQIRNADISRRGFMIGAAGFTFAVVSRLPVGTAEAAGKDVALSPWVTISTDDTVAIMSPAAEMGQGSLNSTPIGRRCASWWHRRTTNSTRIRRSVTCTRPAAMR
jgi:hypothetical protein